MRSLAGLLGSVFLLLGASAATAAEIPLRAVSFLPKNSAVLAMANEWAAQANAAFKGELKIAYAGGPEIVPLAQQGEALRSGAIDILFTVTPYFIEQVPAGLAFALSLLSPAEERQSGFTAAMAAAYRDGIGAQYLGRMHAEPFYLWTRKLPRTLADLRGVRMRTGSLYDRFMQKLGMVPVAIPAPEVALALETGAVDGFGWTTSGVRQQGWSLLAGNVIDLPFFGASNLVALMSRAKWDALTPALRQRLTDFTAAFEPTMLRHFKEAEAKEWAALERSGIRRVKFSAVENKAYLDAAYETEWAYIASRIGPEQTAKLRKMTGN
jgi:TRAP-type C4-dicarboxylate transport system substrate-binding protein